MLIDREIIASKPEDGNADWAIRSEFWIAEGAKCERKRLRRQRNPNALRV